MFLVDNVDNEIRNTFSDYSSTIPKFKRQKGERSDIHINDTYSYDEFLETWRNENVLWNNDDKSEKYLKFKEKVLQQADINRNSQLRMNTGLWDRMDKESPTLGGLVRLLSIEASEASYEKALAAKPYQTILSAIDNSDGNEENVTEMLTSDNTINYLSGQSDYLDGDVFDWYKRARGEDYISSLLVGSTIGASAALTTKLGVGIRKMAKSGMSPDIVKKVVPKILKSTVKNADDKIIAETTEGLAKLTAKTAFKRLTSKSLPFISCAVGAYLTKKRLDEGDPVGAWFEGASATLSGVEAGALTVAGKSAAAVAVPEPVSTIGGTFSLAGSLNVATVSNILAKIIDVGLFIYDIARAMTKEHTEPMNLGLQAKKAQTKILKGVIKHNKYAKMASAISLVYLAYAKLFEKDPIRDQSLGYDEDYETILKELGPMQGRRFLHSKAINKMLNLIKQIKTLDYSLPTYKQERKVLLNKIKVINSSLKNLENTFHGRSFGGKDNIGNILEREGYATRGLTQKLNLMEEREKEAERIKSKFKIYGNSQKVTQAYSTAQAKAAQEVLHKYYGGNEESYYGDLANKPEKIKPLIEAAVANHIEEALLETPNGENEQTAKEIADTIRKEGIKNNQKNQVQATNKNLMFYINKNANKYAQSLALRTLEQKYYRISNDRNGRFMPLEQFIQQNYENEVQNIMPKAKQFIIKNLKKRAISLKAISPDDITELYGKPRPEIFDSESMGIQPEDANIISNANTEIYRRTNETTIEDLIGVPRERNLDPYYKGNIESTPFRSISGSYDSYSELARLSDDALTVVKNHYIKAFNQRKDLEKNLISIGAPDIEIAKERVRKFQALFTINVIKDLIFLRKRWEGIQAKIPKLEGKEQFPNYVEGAASNFSTDYLIAKPFMGRRLLAATSMSNAFAKETTEIQRLRFAKEMFLEKGDPIAADFIQERMEIYHDLLRNISMTTGIGRYEYDKMPIPLQMALEIPIDITDPFAVKYINNKAIPKTLRNLRKTKLGGKFLNSSKFEALTELINKYNKIVETAGEEVPEAIKAKTAILEQTRKLGKMEQWTDVTIKQFENAQTMWGPFLMNAATTIKALSGSHIHNFQLNSIANAVKNLGVQEQMDELKTVLDKSWKQNKKVIAEYKNLQNKWKTTHKNITKYRQQKLFEQARQKVVTQLKNEINKVITNASKQSDTFKATAKGAAEILGIRKTLDKIGLKEFGQYLDDPEWRQWETGGPIAKAFKYLLTHKPATGTIEAQEQIKAFLKQLDSAVENLAAARSADLPNAEKLLAHMTQLGHMPQQAPLHNKLLRKIARWFLTANEESFFSMQGQAIEGVITSKLGNWADVTPAKFQDEIKESLENLHSAITSHNKSRQAIMNVQNQLKKIEAEAIAMSSATQKEAKKAIPWIIKQLITESPENPFYLTDEILEQIKATQQRLKKAGFASQDGLEHLVENFKKLRKELNIALDENNYKKAVALLIGNDILAEESQRSTLTFKGLMENILEFNDQRFVTREKEIENYIRYAYLGDEDIIRRAEDQILIRQKKLEAEWLDSHKTISQARKKIIAKTAYNQIAEENPIIKMTAKTRQRYAEARKATINKELETLFNKRQALEDSLSKLTKKSEKYISVKKNIDELSKKIAKQAASITDDVTGSMKELKNIQKQLGSKISSTRRTELMARQHILTEKIEKEVIKLKNAIKFGEDIYGETIDQFQMQRQFLIDTGYNINDMEFKGVFMFDRAHYKTKATNYLRKTIAKYLENNSNLNKKQVEELHDFLTNMILIPSEVDLAQHGKLLNTKREHLGMIRLFGHLLKGAIDESTENMGVVAKKLIEGRIKQNLRFLNRTTNEQIIDGVVQFAAGLKHNPHIERLLNRVNQDWETVFRDIALAKGMSKTEFVNEVHKIVNKYAGYSKDMTAIDVANLILNNNNIYYATNGLIDLTPKIKIITISNSKKPINLETLAKRINAVGGEQNLKGTFADDYQKLINNPNKSEQWIDILEEWKNTDIEKRKIIGQRKKISKYRSEARKQALQGEMKLVRLEYKNGIISRASTKTFPQTIESIDLDFSKSFLLKTAQYNSVDDFINSGLAKGKKIYKISDDKAIIFDTQKAYNDFIIKTKLTEGDSYTQQKLLKKWFSPVYSKPKALTGPENVQNILDDLTSDDIKNIYEELKIFNQKTSAITKLDDSEDIKTFLKTGKNIETIANSRKSSNTLSQFLYTNNNVLTEDQKFNLKRIINYGRQNQAIANEAEYKTLNSLDTTKSTVKNYFKKVYKKKVEPLVNSPGIYVDAQGNQYAGTLIMRNLSDEIRKKVYKIKQLEIEKAIKAGMPSDVIKQMQYEAEIFIGFLDDGARWQPRNSFYNQLNEFYSGGETAKKHQIGLDITGEQLNAKGMNYAIRYDSDEMNMITETIDDLIKTENLDKNTFNILNVESIIDEANFKQIPEKVQAELDDKGIAIMLAPVDTIKTFVDQNIDMYDAGTKAPFINQFLDSLGVTLADDLNDASGINIQAKRAAATIQRMLSEISSPTERHSLLLYHILGLTEIDNSGELVRLQGVKVKQAIDNFLSLGFDYSRSPNHFNSLNNRIGIIFRELQANGVSDEIIWTETARAFFGVDYDTHVRYLKELNVPGFMTDEQILSKFRQHESLFLSTELDLAKGTYKPKVNLVHERNKGLLAQTIGTILKDNALETERYYLPLKPALAPSRDSMGNITSTVKIHEVNFPLFNRYKKRLIYRNGIRQEAIPQLGDEIIVHASPAYHTDSTRVFTIKNWTEGNAIEMHPAAVHYMQGDFDGDSVGVAFNGFFKKGSKTYNELTDWHRATPIAASNKELYEIQSILLNVIGKDKLKTLRTRKDILNAIKDEAHKDKLKKILVYPDDEWWDRFTSRMAEIDHGKLKKKVQEFDAMSPIEIQAKLSAAKPQGQLAGEDDILKSVITRIVRAMQDLHGSGYAKLIEQVNSKSTDVLSDLYKFKKYSPKIIKKSTHIGERYAKIPTTKSISVNKGIKGGAEAIERLNSKPYGEATYFYDNIFKLTKSSQARSIDVLNTSHNIDDIIMNPGGAKLTAMETDSLLTGNERILNDLIMRMKIIDELLVQTGEQKIFKNNFYWAKSDYANKQKINLGQFIDETSAIFENNKAYLRYNKMLEPRGKDLTKRNFFDSLQIVKEYQDQLDQTFKNINGKAKIGYIENSVMGAVYDDPVIDSFIKKRQYAPNNLTFQRELAINQDYEKIRLHAIKNDLDDIPGWSLDNTPKENANAIKAYEAKKYANFENGKRPLWFSIEQDRLAKILNEKVVQEITDLKANGHYKVYKANVDGQIMYVIDKTDIMEGIHNKVAAALLDFKKEIHDLPTLKSSKQIEISGRKVGSIISQYYTWFSDNNEVFQKTLSKIYLKPKANHYKLILKELDKIVPDVGLPQLTNLKKKYAKLLTKNIISENTSLQANIGEPMKDLLINIASDGIKIKGRKEKYIKNLNRFKNAMINEMVQTGKTATNPRNVLVYNQTVKNIANISEVLSTTSTGAKIMTGEDIINYFTQKVKGESDNLISAFENNKTIDLGDILEIRNNRGLGTELLEKNDPKMTEIFNSSQTEIRKTINKDVAKKLKYTENVDLNKIKFAKRAKTKSDFILAEQQKQITKELGYNAQNKIAYENETLNYGTNSFGGTKAKQVLSPKEEKAFGFIADTINETTINAEDKMSKIIDNLRDGLTAIDTPEGRTQALIHAKIFTTELKKFLLSFIGGGFRFFTFNAVENVSKGLIYSMNEMLKGHDMLWSDIMPFGTFGTKGNANDIWLNLAHGLANIDDMKHIDPRILYNTIEGGRGMNIFDRFGTSGKFQIHGLEGDNWFQKIKLSYDKMNNWYLKKTGDTVENPFRSGLFSHKFNQQYNLAMHDEYMNPMKKLRKAANVANLAVEDVYFDYANKLNIMRGWGGVVFPFGDFRVLNTRYWATRFATNPLLARYVAKTFALSQREKGEDPRNAQLRVPFTNMYLDPFSAMSFNDVAKHFKPKNYFQRELRWELEKEYQKIKDMTEEAQQSYAYRTKYKSDLINYVKAKRMGIIGQVARQLDSWLGMQGIVRSTANVGAAMMNGTIFKDRDYKSWYGAAVDLANNIFWRENSTSPSFLAYIDPSHANYLEERRKKNVKKLQQTMNMSEEQAMSYLKWAEVRKQIIAFISGMFPKNIPPTFAELNQKMAQYTTKKGGNLLVDDRQNFLEYLDKSNIADPDAYLLFSKTKFTLDKNIKNNIKIIPVQNKGKIDYIPIYDSGTPNQKNIIQHIQILNNPLYYEDYERIIGKGNLEEWQYDIYGMLSGKYLKDRDKLIFYLKRGIAPPPIQDAYQKFFNKNKYEELKAVRQFIRQHSKGTTLASIKDEYIDDFKQLDRAERFFKKNPHINKTQLTQIKKSFDSWIYDYALKKYLLTNAHVVDFSEPDSTLKSAMKASGLTKEDMNGLALYSIAKKHGNQLNNLATFSNTEDPFSTAFSPQSWLNTTPEVKKKLLTYFPDIETKLKQGAKYQKDILRESGLMPEPKQKKIRQLPRQLENFAYKPTRKMLRKVFEKQSNIDWLHEHGMNEALARTQRTFVPTFLAQELQKYKSFAN